MIKRYNQYIKENHLDIDPFGEEDWDDNKNGYYINKLMLEGEYAYYGLFKSLKNGRNYTIAIDKNFTDKEFFHINYPFESLDDIEIERVKNEDIGVLCWNAEYISFYGFTPERFTEYKLSEILEKFNIQLSDIHFEKI